KKLARDGKPIDRVREKILALDERPAVQRRYIYHDSTVEKVAILLADNPDGLMLALDEVTGWLAAISQDDRQSERKFYLTAWAGMYQYSVDRLSRPSIHLPVSRISVVGGATPNTLEPFIRHAYGGGHDDGMMQRFQLGVYPDLSPDYHDIDRPPDREA